MAPRSTRLAGPLKVVSGTAPIVYTVPAGVVALVKSIRAVNLTTHTIGIELGVGTVVNDHVVLQATLASLATYIDPDTDPIVLAAGQVIWAADIGAIGSGDFALTLSGAHLTA